MRNYSNNEKLLFIVTVLAVSHEGLHHSAYYLRTVSTNILFYCYQIT